MAGSEYALALEIRGKVDDLGRRLDGVAERVRGMDQRRTTHYNSATDKDTRLAAGLGCFDVGHVRTIPQADGGVVCWRVVRAIHHTPQQIETHWRRDPEAEEAWLEKRRAEAKRHGREWPE